MDVYFLCIFCVIFSCLCTWKIFQFTDIYMPVCFEIMLGKGKLFYLENNKKIDACLWYFQLTFSLFTK